MRLILAFFAFALVAVAPAQARFASDRLAVTVTGNGPDVVLIHGLSSSTRVWDGVVAAVPGYRYHLVQIGGFAGHPPAGNAGDGPFLAPVAEEIARYVKEETEAPALVGHSMGGSLALMIAARYPGLASRVMVVDMLPFMGAMFGPPGATAESVAPIAAQIRDRMMKSPADERRATTEATIAGMVRTEARRAEPVAETLASDQLVSARGYHDLIVTDLRPELAAIEVPLVVLYVTPTGVPLTDAQMDDIYRRSFANAPNAELKRVPDSAHFIMYDQPGRFAEALKAFLAR